MANYLGSSAALYFDNNNSPAISATYKVGQISEVSFPQEPLLAEKTSNDSGMRGEHGVARLKGDFSCKAFLNRADNGQAKLFSAIDVEAGGTCMGTAIYCPEGVGTGKPKKTFACSVSIKPSEPMDGYATIEITLSPSGAVTSATQ